MVNNLKFYINGEWVDPVAPKIFEVVDPTTELACATISLGSAADVEIAVDAARRAFPGWRNTPPTERLLAVKRLLDIYQRRREEMATAISREMGAPIDFALQRQVAAGRYHMTNFVNAFESFEFERKLGDHAPNDRIVMDPIGVVGLITPWNWPMNQIALKVVPAMLSGCTMVLKPSEVSPLSGLLFAECIDEAGFPKGVFNLVNGDGAGVGHALSTHPDIQMISFTGSTRAGIEITKSAAESLKRVALELGGKGANIVFADADADAVKRGTLHCFANTGQSCNAPTRMLVHRSIYDQAVEIAKQVADSLAVGPAHEHGAHIGPVASRQQFEKVQRMIEIGIDEGARLVAGGLGRPKGLDRGYFVRPTVFADVTRNMTIARDEIFGPVLSMMPFDTEDEAVELANDTQYGLTNYVQTEDGQKRNRVARQLCSGMIEMNGQPRAPGSPFGGVKRSGRAREGGWWGIEEFLEPKAISGWAPEI